MSELEALARAALAEAARGDELDDRARTAFIDAATPAAWLDLLAKNKALAERVAGLEEGLGDLIDALDAVVEPAKQIEIFAHAHGYRYTGPNFGNELARARTLITGADHAKG